MPVILVNKVVDKKRRGLRKKRGTLGHCHPKSLFVLLSIV
jgi:hypothetical protein